MNRPLLPTMSRRRISFALLIAFLLGVAAYPGLRNVGRWLADRVETRPAPVRAQFATAPFVLVVLGQSNAANHAEGRMRAGRPHLAFHEGQFYELADPVPGCTGKGGSPWPSFALAAPQHAGAAVVVVCLAVGGSSVDEWRPGTANFARVRRATQQLREAGLSVNAFVWHQGETDNQRGLPAAAYSAALEEVVVALGELSPSSPLFVCKASYVSDQVPASAAIRQAQQAVIDKYPRVYAGVDTDEFPASLRSGDGIHFTLTGAELFGRLLAQAVRQPSDVSLPRKALL